MPRGRELQKGQNRVKKNDFSRMKGQRNGKSKEKQKSRKGKSSRIANKGKKVEVEKPAKPAAAF